MKRTALCLVLALVIAVPVLRAGDPAELAGRWVGGIDTPRGQMDIGLDLTLTDGRLAGALKTAHGDWKVTGVTEKDGVWTVSFDSPGGPGKLSGRVKETRFTGDWESPMAKGVFELTRSKKPQRAITFLSVASATSARIRAASAFATSRPNRVMR